MYIQRIRLANLGMFIHKGGFNMKRYLASFLSVLMVFNSLSFTSLADEYDLPAENVEVIEAFAEEQNTANENTSEAAILASEEVPAINEETAVEPVQV